MHQKAIVSAGIFTALLWISLGITEIFPWSSIAPLTAASIGICTLLLALQRRPEAISTSELDGSKTQTSEFEERGLKASSRHKYELAIPDLEKANLLNPKNATVLTTLGQIYIYTKKINEFNSLVEKAKSELPYAAFYLLGYKLMFENPPQAVIYFDKAIAIWKGYPTIKEKAFIAKANSLLLLKEYKRSLDASEAALLLNPHSVYSMINKANSLMHLDQQNYARETIMAALPFITTEYHRACAYAIIEDKKNMLDALRESLKRDEAYTIYHINQDPDFDKFKQDPDFQKLIPSCTG